MKRLLLFLFMLGSVAQAQLPTYHLVLKNDSLINSTTYNYDIYLVNTSTSTFQLAAIQLIMYFNPGISAGTLHLKILSTELVAEQRPLNSNLSINGNELRIAANPPPGPGGGTFIPPYPGTLVGRIQLSSSAPFLDQRANIRWKNSGSNPWTKVFAYDSAGNNVEITDTTGHLDSLANASLSPPVINTTSPLNAGTTTLPYADTLVASGGTAPYSWSATSGSLPPGVSLATSGIITGTPTTAGIYTFTARVTDALGDSASASFTITIAQRTVNVSASAGANGTIAPSGTVVVNYGSTQSFTLTPSTGYHVDSLVVDGVLLPAAPSYSFVNDTVNHTIRASFAINQFTITPSAGLDGSIAPPTATIVNYGGSQIFSFTPTTGYHVDSLFVDSVSQPVAPSYTFTNVTANHTIRVTFAIDQFTITPSAGANGTISPSTTVTLSFGSSQVFTFTPSTGYHVDSLIVDGVQQTAAPSYAFNNVSANHTIRVTFAINQFTITASSGPNGTISPSGTVLVAYGGSQTFNFNPSVGYHVDSVIVDGVLLPATASYTFTNDTSNHTIRVSFKIDQFTITPSAGPNGSISPSSPTIVDSGASQTFSFFPATGYHVDSIIVDGVSQPLSPIYTFTSVNANHTIRVTFAINQYTITASSGANGSITPSGSVIETYGSSQTFNFTPATGYHVDSLLVDNFLQPVAPSYTFDSIKANHTIRVTFAIRQFTIVASAGTNGTITPSGNVGISYGGSQAFTFTPSTGYHVDSLVVDGVLLPAAPGYTFTNDTSNHTIRVSFAINQFTITPSAGLNGTISPSVPTAVNYGASQTFNFTPAAGYHVDSLFVDSVSQPAASSFAFVNVTANHTIRVTFAINQYTIVASSGANGTIAPSGTIPLTYGSNQTFNFTPSLGYHVDSLVVDGVLLAPAASYTFNSVSANHTIRVSFAPNQLTITVQTNPPGNSVTVDGTRYVSSPQVFTWTAGTTHTIFSDTIQGATSSTRLVWTTWSDTTVNAHSVTPLVNTTYTASFKRQFYLTMIANAGGTVTPASGWNDSGAVVTITAFPSPNYSFTDWGGSGTGSTSGSLNPTTVRMGSAITEVANFNHNPVLVTVQTNPSGLVFRVDGFTKTTPYTFSFSPGQTHSISTDSIQVPTGSSQMAYKGWSDNGAITHTILFPGNDTTFTATFKPQYFVTISAGSGGTVTPSSAYYDSAATVRISATPLAGFTFSGWTGTGIGSYTGLNNPDTISVRGPISETANFTAAPIHVTIKSNPRGRTFTVDTSTVSDSVSLIWTAATTHQLSTTSPQTGDSVTQFFWKSWSDGGTQTHSVTPVRDTVFTVNFRTQYWLTMLAGAGGTASPASGWRDSGTTVGISATPSTGYSFGSWTGVGAGSYSGTVNNTNITMNSAVRESAAFTPNPVQITFLTNPAGRSVIVDTVHYTAPVTLTWAAASVHSISIDSIQAGAPGRQYLWKTWSDGGARTHTVSSLVNASFTATFGTQFSLTTGVDSGGTVTPATAFRDSGTVVSVQATPLAGFRFSSWSGSGTGSYTGTANPASVTMTSPITETAHFVRFAAQVTVQTNVAGLNIQVDDTLYTSPHVFSWQTGSSHKISTTTPQPTGATTTRYVWNNWNDGGAITHFVTPLTDTAFTATFGTQYYLTMTANTGGTVSPPSNWYNAGQVVMIIATPSTGYSFVGWTGSGTGSYGGINDTGFVTMNSAISEIASFNRNNVVVTVQTNPPGMPFTLGGATTYYTPQTRSVTPGTQFTIVAVSPYSVGTGAQFTWTNWSDSGAQSHSVTALTDTVLTATFRKQYYIRMAAGPGGTVTPATGWQDSGSTVQMLATPNTGYAFYRWYGTGTGSYNGIANPANVLITGTFADSASFSSFPISVTIQSNPPGRTIIVDGAADTITRHLSWSSGSPHTIAVPDTQAGGTGVRYLWTSWSDSGAKSHSVSPVSDTTFTVSFRPQYFLTMNAGTGGSVTPASSWYDAGRRVVITAFPNATYNFGGWNGTGTGSYTGISNPDSVTMNGPITETASFPHIPVSVTIRTTPDSLFFLADTVAYKSPQTFLWDLGSQHSIGVATPQAGASGVQYIWKTWSDGGTATHTITPQRDTTFIAGFGTQFYLTVAHDTGGTTTPASGWQDSGKAVTLTALPGPGYAFTSWRGSGAGSYTGTVNPIGVTVNGPIHDTAAFSRFQANVTFRTNPAGLQVLVDGAAYTTPVTIPWTTGASHTITAVDSQYNGSFTRYIWSTWSDSGARIHSISALRDTTFTANFTTQYYVTMTANPGGTVSPLSGWFNSGQVVSITAFSSSGYQFARWTGTGTGSYSGFLNSASITVGSPITEVASFSRSAFQVQVQAVPFGRSFTVAGFTYNTPQTYSVALGNNVFSVGAPSPQQIGAGTQYAWKSWSDSGAQTHTVTVVSDTTFTVYFGLQYQLTTTASPANSGATNPPNGTFFDVGDTAFVTAVANPHFAFVNWSGAISGSQSPAEVIMSSPKSIIANFGAAPQITVTSDTAGRSVTIDDSVYTTPAVVYWLAGTGHTIDAMSPQPGTPGVQYVWKDWSDSGAVSHTVTTQRDTVFKASYRPQYYLTMNAGSGGGVSPASGWFSKDTTVTITATPAPGFAFVRWTGTGPGSYSGYSTQATVTVSGPIGQTASFGRILAAPTLVSPADGSTGVIPTPVLVWHSYAGVSSYHIQIARDSLFTQLSVDSTLQRDTVFVAPPLPNIMKQYWRLNALVGANITLYSTVWSFTTIPGTITAIPPLINWATGFTYPITWASTTLSGGVNIKLSVDNGSTWRVLRSNIPNSGITFWKVPDTMRVSNLSKFRVESALNPAIYGESVLFGIVSGALPSTIRLSTSIPYPSAPAITDYRLVSIPGVVDTMSIGNLIGGTQGTDWRAFADNGAASNYLIELTENSRLTTGEGYWLVKKGTLTISNFLMGLPHLDTLEARFSIPLHLGWNIIANPFDQNLPWNDVMTVNGLPTSTPLITYEGFYTTKSVMEPFTGYYFMNDTNTTLSSLVLPYPFGSVAGAVTAPVADWSVQVSLETGTNKDPENYFGVGQSLKAGRNELSYPKPPLFMDQAFLYFPHPEWDRTYPRFMADIRPGIGSGQTWTFEVLNPGRTKGTLRFTGIEHVPAGQRVVLINQYNSRPVDLRVNPVYAYETVSPRMQFRILVGPDAYVDQEVKRTAPERFELAQNFPNPFNPSTAISLQLQREAPIRLEIYSTLGQVVRTLADGTYPQGTITFTWDGTNNEHRMVASGVYFYRLIADGNVIQTRKMILAR